MPSGRDYSPQGILVDQLSIEIEAARSKGMKLWHERLKLWIRPKPRFVPTSIWYWLVWCVLDQKTVMEQSLMNPDAQQKPVVPGLIGAR